MNEKIDLTKILKDCPIGWKFYSSVYGDVEFVEIYREPVLCNPGQREDEWLGQEIQNSKHPIIFDADGNEHSVSRRGEMIKASAIAAMQVLIRCLWLRKKEKWLSAINVK